MTLRGQRILRAIQRYGSSMTVGTSAVVGLLRPLNMSQLQIFATSGEFASWERPAYLGVFPPDTGASPEDEFVGPDFEGIVKRVIPVRLMGELVALQLLIQKLSPPTTP